MGKARWDLTALLNAADPAAAPVERHLWLIRLLEWLRDPGPQASPASPDGEASAARTETDPAQPGPGTAWPVRRLRHLLNVLDRHPAHRERVAALLRGTLPALDPAGLLADFGFAPRHGFLSELSERLRLACLPGTPQTRDLGELFQLLFTGQDDATWIAAIDDTTWQRLLDLGVESPAAAPWQPAMVESIQLLCGQMRASAMGGLMRQRMDPALLTHRPFHELAKSAETLREQHADGGEPDGLLPQAHYLRAALAASLEAAASVRDHLDEHGISVNLVFQADQLRRRAERIETLLACLIAPRPGPELRRLVTELARAGAERRGLRPLFAQHYALLARKVTERSAETGEHYITRDHGEYRAMLGQAAGGGAVIGLTTLVKFGIAALALSTFWAGFWAGINYAASFVVVHLLHWTVATKQPAMTAPSMAAKLEGVSASDAAVEAFVDEVAHLLRSQFAGIIGNLALVVPVVLAAQGLAWWLAGAPLIGAKEAHHVLHSLTLLGPTPLYAAFTGVLLFASSLIAGWVENWFVFHRLDSAIAWNPRILGALGASRAQRGSRWWRANISGLAANVSLGLLLGLVPALASFFGLPLEVRHVTLAMGQLSAAAGALGPAVFQEPAFWWCLAAIPLTGLLNLGVSFTLAFKVAVASRGLKLRDRGRVRRAIGARLRRAPSTFLMPPPKA